MVVIEKCNDETWLLSISTSVGVWLGCLLVMIFVKMYQINNSNKFYIAYLNSKNDHNDKDFSRNYNVTLYTKVRLFCEKLAAGQTIFGKILLILSFLMSTLSLVIYVDLSYKLNSADQNMSSVNFRCISWTEYPKLWVDFSFNIFFFFHLIIRLIADNFSVLFFFQPVNLADICNISHIIISFIFKEETNAFRFLRAIRIISLPDILMYFHILRARSAIRLMQLICNFMAVWFGGAGFIHLLENLGNFWDDSNSESFKNWTVFDSLYFMIVTMSTVGYGDISPKTTVGRFFICFYIIMALGVFASSVPEIMDIMRDQKLYSGSHDFHTGKRFVIVTGYINYRTMRHFLKEFLHPDRRIKQRNINVIFLGSETPDIKTRALLKRKRTQVKYFEGSVTVLTDMKRIKLELAEAVIILCNLQAKDPDEMDWTSIMRVIAIKDVYPNMKIIVQILQYKNKAYLQNIPNWHHSISASKADQAVCLSELKMGLMAQSCVAQGFSTLLANLFTMNSVSSKKFKKNSWQNEYAHGANYEMYRVNFSKSFDNKTFLNAVSICMSKLDVILVAVEIQWNDDERRILVNPSDNIRIRSRSMAAFVISSDESRALSVEYWCENCHSYDWSRTVSRNNVTPLKRCTTCIHFQGGVEAWRGLSRQDILPCHCGRPSCSRSGNLVDTSRRRSLMSENKSLINKYHKYLYCDKLDSIDKMHISKISNDNVTDGGVATSTTMETLQLRRASIQMSPSKNCNVDSTGLFHYCKSRTLEEATLESFFCSETHRGSIEKKFFQHIVICLLATPNCPAIGLCNFIMPLRSSFILEEEIKDIIIVGDIEYVRNEWTSLQNFPKLYLLKGSPLNRAFLRAVDVENCAVCVVLSATRHGSFNSSTEISLIDKEAVLCTLNIKTMPTACGTAQLGEIVPIITELHEELNVSFLDQDDEPNVHNISMSQPYATGHMFHIKILDSLMSTTFFNPSALDFLQALVSGGSTGEVEAILAEGLGLMPRLEPANTRCRFQCRVVQLSLDEPPLNEFMRPCGQKTCFGELFQRTLLETGVICIGIYRCQQAPTQSERNLNKWRRRFVITSPHKQKVILKHDKIFCLKPMCVGYSSTPNIFGVLDDLKEVNNDYNSDAESNV